MPECLLGALREAEVILAAEILVRAQLRPSISPPVVDAPDLILLKLYAGGSQDRADVEQLLALDAGGATARAVDKRISALPLRSREIWSALRQRP